MEYSLENIQKFKIFARTTPTDDVGGYKFVHEGNVRTAQSTPQFDFFIPLMLTRTGSLSEYVEIFRDTSIYKIERQEVNPWFLEFSFFDSIKYNKPTVGSGLTQVVIDYIRRAMPETESMNNDQVRVWFDTVGYNDLPWYKGQSNEITADFLDKLSLNNEDIVSKAFFRKIDINK